MYQIAVFTELVRLGLHKNATSSILALQGGREIAIEIGTCNSYCEANRYRGVMGTGLLTGDAMKPPLRQDFIG